MQSKSVLQPCSFGIGIALKESKAKSEASQRDHLKPSKCKVGDKFYRYESHLVSSGVDEWDEPLGPGYMALYCSEFEVVKVYPKGAYIQGYFCKNGGEEYQGRPVMDHYINKYAYPTKVEALLGFMARKKRQQTILNRQLANSHDAEQKAEQMLSKELNQ